MRSNWKDQQKWKGIGNGETLQLTILNRFRLEVLMKSGEQINMILKFKIKFWGTYKMVTLHALETVVRQNSLRHEDENEL